MNIIVKLERQFLSKLFKKNSREDDSCAPAVGFVCILIFFFKTFSQKGIIRSQSIDSRTKSV